MPPMPAPENLEIAALKRKAEARLDPMVPGPGTPWEDRGTHGAIGAYFKTVGMSLFSPAKLAANIRRPETTADANSFLIISAIWWAAAAFITGMIWKYQLAKRPDIDIQNYTLDIIIAAIAAGVAVWLLFRLYNIIYPKLVAQEKNQFALRPALLFNINAYAMGPSILALIPFAGPPLALLWIFIDLIAVGRGRLHLRFAAALIDSLIPLMAVVVIVVVAYFVGGFLLGQVLPPYDVIQQTTH